MAEPYYILKHNLSQAQVSQNLCIYNQNVFIIDCWTRSFPWMWEVINGKLGCSMNKKQAAISYRRYLMTGINSIFIVNIHSNTHFRLDVFNKYIKELNKL